MTLPRSRVSEPCPTHGRSGNGPATRPIVRDTPIARTLFAMPTPSPAGPRRRPIGKSVGFEEREGIGGGRWGTLGEAVREVFS